MLDCMNEKGLVPHATLWHYTHPSWFDDLGGFEDIANIKHFIEYADLVFRRFRAKIQLWVTFNEPIVALLGSYFVGLTPPGYIGRVSSVGKVYANMLRAHALTYR